MSSTITPPPSDQSLPQTRKLKRTTRISTTTILLLIGTNGISFLGGVFFVSNRALKDILHHHQQYGAMPDVCQQSLQKMPKECPACPACPKPEENGPGAEEGAEGNTAAKQSSGGFIPERITRIATGMAHTTFDDFTTKFDLGVPLDNPKVPGDEGVLILYSRENAMPRKMRVTNSIELLTAHEATENCEYMNVILTYHEGRRNQCVAIVPQYESFHIQRWMRVPGNENGKATFDLQLVPRTYKPNSDADFSPPKYERHTKQSWEVLKTFIESVDDVLGRLKPIVNKIKKDNTVVVMTSNFGQSQLMLNFVCAARSKGFDISNVIVFATDPETKDLAESIGLTAFYDEKNFGQMPKQAAIQYGDRKFTKMMLAKVICVLLISLCDVDLLFQDVDIIWYKSPLELFHNASSPLAKFDAIFQDDGSKSGRFAPFCANSGFYYFRSNERTRYFLTSFLMQSDLILRTFSHQAAMIAVLAEHQSLLGLKVKTLDLEDFPSGFIYHRKKGKGRYGNFFVDFFDGKKDPYIFHMSWTSNKDNKILFYKQLGEWYLQEKCMDKELSAIPMENNNLPEACCSAEALFSCHYRDKPSSKPCRSSPPLDKGAPSFW